MIKKPSLISYLLLSNLKMSYTARYSIYRGGGTHPCKIKYIEFSMCVLPVGCLPPHTLYYLLFEPLTRHYLDELYSQISAIIPQLSHHSKSWTILLMQSLQGISFYSLVKLNLNPIPWKDETISFFRVPFGHIFP